MTMPTVRLCRNVAGGVILMAVTLVVAAGSLSAQQRGLRPDDYYDLVTVSEVAVSPLGPSRRDYMILRLYIGPIL